MEAVKAVKEAGQEAWKEAMKEAVKEAVHRPSRFAQHPKDQVVSSCSCNHPPKALPEHDM